MTTPILLALSAAAIAAGCGGGHATATSAHEPVPTTRLMPVTPGGSAGPVVTVPTEGGVRPISPVFDAGTQILITPSGFYPRILIANIKVPIVWTNLTTVVQRLIFLQQPGESDLIPPGGKWSYNPPDGVNLHYSDHSLGITGTVDFNPAP